MQSPYASNISTKLADQRIKTNRPITTTLSNPHPGKRTFLNSHTSGRLHSEKRQITSPASTVIDNRSGYQGTRLLNNLSSLVTNPIVTPVTNGKITSSRGEAPLDNNSQL